MVNIYQINGTYKEAGVNILTSDKANIEPKLVKKDNEGDFILIQGIIHQEDMTDINTHTEHKCTRLHKTSTTAHKGMDRPQYSYRVRLQSYLLILCSPVNRPSRQKKS